jgi:cytochrome P450
VRDTPETAPEIRSGFPQIKPVEQVPAGLGRFVAAMRRLRDLTASTNPDLSMWTTAAQHTCLGLHLARLETRVALDCLLSRLSNVNLVTDGDPHIHGQPFRSPTALPVTFDAK